MKKGKILVIKTSDLFPDGIWEGFREDPGKKIYKIIQEKSFFKERSEVEEDESLQQIVAQIALVCGSTIFIHRVPSSGSDKRMHDLWPILLGGHVDETDSDIKKAIEREFSEEIDYEGKLISKKYVGIVKLHDNPVNKVHVGLVHVFIGDTKEFSSTSDGGIADGKFVDISKLRGKLNQMSYWSQAFYPYLQKFI